MATREGTRDQVGDEIEIVPGKRRYVIQRDAKRKAEVSDPCSDRFPRKCPSWEAQGECRKNPGWMIVNCPKSCKSCELLDPQKRCDRAFLNITEEHVWAPGDLNRMFERILSDYPQYEPRAVSRPPDGPWVVVFDKFLQDAEVASLISWGERLGFKRSTDVGQRNERGETTKVVSQHRTSSNAWCSRDCENDPHVASVTQRTEEILKIPATNYESFQLLEYTEGQYYREHHDMSPRAWKEAGGPRILTFFLYLSDVEEGGETHFPKVDIKVPPQEGGSSALAFRARSGSA
ncbi:Probable prolyl 4-hydroxylase 7 (AtP4H7) [Durusdinium trenchii]|uniref:Probable prolyl 4-hydroxylase 7 (AtP4H7) n=1 Tax=Durusdinium trenchii TaxID=1381693 RepID=A0ABP0LB23_9DINO